MQIFRFDDPPTHTIAQFGSVHAAIGGVARGTSPFQIGYLRLDPGGVLGMHPALSAQLLLILSGEGWVSSGDGVRRAGSEGEEDDEHWRASGGGCWRVRYTDGIASPSDSRWPT